MKNKEIFKQRLRSLMEINQVTRQDLVKSLNTSEANVCRYCNGETIPRDKTLKKMCEIFDVNENWLLGYDNAINEKYSTIDETQALYQKYKDLLPDEDKQYINYIVKQSIIRIDKKIKDEK